MAPPHPELEEDGGKRPHESQRGTAGPDEEVGTAPGSPAEYDIERIEKVYRKLDLRIIPGKTEMPLPSGLREAPAPDSPRQQPSGSSTFSAPPSAPISAWRRP